MKKIVSLCVSVCLLTSHLIAGVRYVDSSSTNSLQDGLSWTTAYHTLSDALAWANTGGSTTDSILVAGGTYFPNGISTALTSRDTTFLLSRTNIKIYGGYPAGGGVRDLVANPTYLDGNINMPASTIFDNSFHVMVIAGINSSATDSIVLDGLTFRNGNARDTSSGAYTYNGVAINRNTGGGLCLINNSGARPVALRSCTFTQNLAVNGGGGYSNNTAMEISNCSFNGNSVASAGGGFYCMNTNANIAGTTFEQNTILAPASGSANRSGAGMYNKRSQLAIRNSDFTNNLISNGTASGAGLYNDSTTVALDSCQFTGNYISSVAGAGNTGLGGGICNNVTSPLITHCVFTNNKISVDYTSGDAEGGAIYTFNARPEISYCDFIADSVMARGVTLSPGIMNQPFCFGGAIYGSSTLTYCNFSDNFAARFGGAVFVGTSTIDSCSFTNNMAVNGGGVYQNSGALQVTRSRFNNNWAYRGGAINVGSGQATSIIGRCTFNNNGANEAGGAIINSGNMSAINCRFTSDSAATGTAICNFSGYNGIIATTSVDRCIFDSNRYKPSGSGNAPDGLPYGMGGAIFNARVQDFKISNSVFYRNIGGGITNTYSTSCKVYNSVLVRNPIRNDFTAPQSVTVANSILLGPAPVSYEPNGSAPVISYSLVQGTVADAVNHNLDGSADPQFADTANFNFQLQATSPCIDAGNNSLIPAGILADAAANARIANGIVDMGAYEFGSTPLPLSLLSFTGKLQTNGTALLEWQTAAEENTAYFELQRSRDGRSFSTIATVTAAGSGNRRYTATDAQPETFNMYRLHIVDHDGKSTYSDVVRLNKNSIKQASFCYPNPAISAVTLHIGDASLLHSRATITDVSGRVTGNILITAMAQNMPVAGLPPGIYIIKLQNGEAIKLVKQL